MSRPRHRGKNAPLSDDVGNAAGGGAAPHPTPSSSSPAPAWPSQQQNASKTKANPPPPRPVQGKLVLRQLPTVGFDIHRARECLASTIARLGLADQDVDLHHFMEGKISRKRGPVPGSCFLLFRSPAALAAFVQRCPHEVPFIEGESIDLQPVVDVPLFQKTAKKDRPDRLEGTIASDEDFLAFCASLDAPPASMKSVASAPQGSGGPASKDPRESALLRFLCEADGGKSKGKKAAPEVAVKPSKKDKEKQKAAKESENKAASGSKPGKIEKAAPSPAEAGAVGSVGATAVEGPGPASEPVQGKKQKTAKGKQPQQQVGGPQQEEAPAVATTTATAPPPGQGKRAGGSKEKGAGKKGGGGAQLTTVPAGGDGAVPAVVGKITVLKRSVEGPAGGGGGSSAPGMARLLASKSIASSFSAIETTPVPVGPADASVTKISNSNDHPPSGESAPTLLQIKDNRGKPKPRKQQQPSPDPSTVAGESVGTEPSGAANSKGNSKGNSNNTKGAGKRGPPPQPVTAPTEG